MSFTVLVTAPDITIDGKELTVASAPLDEYEVNIEGRTMCILVRVKANHACVKGA